ncbi:NPCBM/NEW2 domain-containing protein [Paucibacter sp. DJ1R-11]|uniref:TIM-barrel domain-containing protein n=1 Tax=Paucibacter sp. DJ1R-11 TaxID=2893556 RepID=UPI0021E425BE|nr:TIM-barrel domain-containing protein [Paucibacter sp. DJ1R-11]MCV2364264.1 NPCBM/NEW2 domain-containing protein [Paucibacter sp. DJ1R-11]
MVKNRLPQQQQRQVRPTALRSPALALAMFQVCGGLLLAAAEVAAAPLGALREIQAVPASATPAPGEGAQQWDLRTDSKMRLRISLLKPDVLRLWAGAKDQLPPATDKAAPIVIETVNQAVAHSWSDQGDHHLLKTEALALRVYKKPLRLALYKADNRSLLWQETQSLDIADKLSVQTLSSQKDERFFGGGQQNGRYEFKGKQLEVSYSGGWEEGDRPSPAPFLMSSRGWGMLRNTWSDGSYDLRSPEQISLQHQEGRFDAFFFVGPSIREVLARYTELTGRARLLPRWAYEYGDADCYNDGDNVKKPGTVPKGWSDGPTGKTPDVLNSVARKYREHDMPGGWILPNDGYGCGYTDLPDVVKGLADLGFRTGLWTENGVDKIKWEVGTAGSRAQKLDVAWTGQGYQFAMDANQSAFKGILDNSDARPFLWTVMGWAGIQRYAVTWTGDQSSSWDYIRWHIPTLVGSGLSGQVYATGDVDAIFGGSPETYTRDLQWKTFTPVLMGMSGWAEAARKHPWAYEEPYRSINRKYLKLKMRLMPYMYTLAHEAEVSGAPLVRGLMWDHPQDPAAYTEAHKYQFLLGRDLLVAPVYRSQAASGGWRKNIHLPQGHWFDYWDGRSVRAPEAGRTIDLQVSLDKLPVFVRGGAILPLYPESLYDGEKPKDELGLDLYPLGESSFTLYEDDGLTRQYREQGKSSRQLIRMSAPTDGAGDVRVQVGAVEGEYAGQLAQRRLALSVHTRVKPASVELGGQLLPELADAQALQAASQGWFFDAADRFGTVQIKTGPRSIRQPASFLLKIAAGSVLAGSEDFPAAPVLGRQVPVDSLTVVNRPAEEPGHNIERAFDGKPETWFRSTRNQAMKAGPHEWVLGLGERRLIDGIEIAPRNDKNWKYGQVRDFEVYMGDNNGDWGAPVLAGRLPLKEGLQTITFPKPAAGRLLRFRVLSTHNATADAPAALDPMVTAVADKPGAVPAKAFNALVPSEVEPIALSEFHVLEHRAAEGAAEQQRYLSELPALGAARRDRPASAAPQMRMNGLQFHKGLGVGASSRLDFSLSGNWNLFRADLGVDDSCRSFGGLQFQVWGDGRLLYDSGLVQAPAVVKPELDVRGLQRLSLRTLGATGSQAHKVCANWANASLLGLAGATVKHEAALPQPQAGTSAPR